MSVYLPPADKVDKPNTEGLFSQSIFLTQFRFFKAQECNQNANKSCLRYKLRGNTVT